MTVKELDYLFPFIVFSYGVVITFVFQSGLVSLGKGRIPEAFLQQMQSNRILGLVCLFVGGLWSLQNLLMN